MTDVKTRPSAGFGTGTAHKRSESSHAPSKSGRQEQQNVVGMAKIGAWRKSHLGPVDVCNSDPSALRKVDRMAASDAAYQPPILDAEDVSRIKKKWVARQKRHLSSAAPMFGYRESVAHILRADMERGVGASPGTVSAPAADYVGYIKGSAEEDRRGSSSHAANPGLSSFASQSDSMASCDKTNTAWNGKKVSPIQTARGRFASLLKSFQSKPKAPAKTASPADLQQRADGTSTR